jgi:hypothetical protein
MLWLHLEEMSGERHAFGFNRETQALYEQMGFEGTKVLMSKRLDGTPTGS